MTISERIANELAKTFPDAIIYTESQAEGFEQPSFFISKILTDVQPEFFQVQNRKYHYQIVYFPNPDRVNTDLEQVEEQLLNDFLDLTDFATIRKREFQTDHTNNVLELNFEVWLRMRPVDDEIKQGAVKINGKTKE